MVGGSNPSGRAIILFDQIVTTRARATMRHRVPSFISCVLARWRTTSSSTLAVNSSVELLASEISYRPFQRTRTISRGVRRRFDSGSLVFALSSLVRRWPTLAQPSRSAWRASPIPHRCPPRATMPMMDNLSFFESYVTRVRFGTRATLPKHGRA